MLRLEINTVHEIFQLAKMIRLPASLMGPWRFVSFWAYASVGRLSTSRTISLIKWSKLHAKGRTCDRLIRMETSNGAVDVWDAMRCHDELHIQ